MSSYSANPRRCSLLVIDDDPGVLTTLSLLAAKEFEVLTATSAEAGQSLFATREIDLVLADQNLAGITGVQLLEWVRRHSPKSVRMLMTGLGKFEDAVEAINCGQVSHYLAKPWRNEEVLHVLRNAARNFLLEQSYAQLLEELRQLNLDLEHRVLQRTLELEEANHQLQQQNLMLQKLALTDPLTNLPNRRAMEQLARSEVRRRTRYPSPLALGLIDVDHFKEVNSRYLLPGGDQVLIGLAKAITASLRTVDTVGRIGGEEFMVIAPETNAEGATTLGERIRQAVATTPFLYKDVPISITVSLGFAVAEPETLLDYDQLKHTAAVALGEAKAAGRNRCVYRTVIPNLRASEAHVEPMEPIDSGT